MRCKQVRMLPAAGAVAIPGGASAARPVVSIAAGAPPMRLWGARRARERRWPLLGPSAGARRPATRLELPGLILLALQQLIYVIVP